MTEDEVWSVTRPEDLWVLDKLILSRRLGYVCGPVGMDVPKPDWYIVRPCVNMIGLGKGAEKVWIDIETMHFPLGYFWCEWFEGRHLSVDYVNKKQSFAVEGVLKSVNDLTKWKKWFKVTDEMPMPECIDYLIDSYETINIEYIGNRVIEIHLRGNPDFESGISEFIPDFGGNEDLTSLGYEWIVSPEYNGRIGACVK